MSGHVDLRDDHDAALTGIADDVANLVVGVEAALLASLLHVLGCVELGIGLALNAPTGVVRQVPVEDIELIEREEIEVLLQQFHGAEVTTRVVHEAADGEGGPVLDGYLRVEALFVAQLSQRLTSPDHTLLCLGREHSLAGADADGVALIGQLCMAVEAFVGGRDTDLSLAVDAHLLGCGDNHLGPHRHVEHCQKQDKE